MFTVILVIHTLLCLLLIGLVLIQQGKGADMGAAFGGGSNTVFGAGGAADFITRLTTGVAIAFMATSILLVRAYSSRTQVSSVTTADPLAGSVMEGSVKPETVKPETAAVVATPESTAAPAASVAATIQQQAVSPAPEADKEKK